MHDQVHRPSLRALALGAGLLLSLAARAELGGDRAGVERDARAFAGVHTIEHIGSYERHEITREDGSRLREYVSAKGTVFALSWDGRVGPDIKALLGEHYAAYVAAAAKLPPSHHVRNVTVGALSVAITHLGRYGAGRVLLGTEIPAGVASEDLR
jgi:hypothetical protein